VSYLFFFQTKWLYWQADIFRFDLNYTVNILTEFGVDKGEEDESRSKDDGSEGDEGT